MSVYSRDINMDKYQTINVVEWLGFVPLNKNQTPTKLFETQTVGKDDERTRQEETKTVFMKW